MFAIYMLNDANEWETCYKLFATREAAEQYAESQEFYDVWADVVIEQLETA